MTPVAVTRLAGGQPAMRAPDGVRANSPCGLKQRAALIRLALCFSARPQRGGGDRKTERSAAGHALRFSVGSVLSPKFQHFE